MANGGRGRGWSCAWAGIAEIGAIQSSRLRRHLLKSAGAPPLRPRGPFLLCCARMHECRERRDAQERPRPKEVDERKGRPVASPREHHARFPALLAKSGRCVTRRAHTTRLGLDNTRVLLAASLRCSGCPTGYLKTAPLRSFSPSANSTRHPYRASQAQTSCRITYTMFAQSLALLGRVIQGSKKSLNRRRCLSN